MALEHAHETSGQGVRQTGLTECRVAGTLAINRPAWWSTLGLICITKPGGFRPGRARVEDGGELHGRGTRAIRVPAWLWQTPWAPWPQKDTPHAHRVQTLYQSPVKHSNKTCSCPACRLRGLLAPCRSGCLGEAVA